jgi:hypothetical protein
VGNSSNSPSHPEHPRAVTARITTCSISRAFALGLRNLIHGEKAAAVEFVEVRAGSGITGVGRNGEPDIGGEAVLRNAAAVLESLGIEILRLRKSLVGGNFIEGGSLGVILIRHQAAQVVGAEGIILIGGQLEPFSGQVGIAQSTGRGSRAVRRANRPADRLVEPPCDRGRAPAPDLW